MLDDAVLTTGPPDCLTDGAWAEHQPCSPRFCSAAHRYSMAFTFLTITIHVSWDLSGSA